MKRRHISQAMRREVAERYGCLPGEEVAITCAYCDDQIIISRLEGPTRVRFLDSLGRSRPELDHVESVLGGGPNTAGNLVPACLRCNRSKGPRRLV